MINDLSCEMVPHAGLPRHVLDTVERLKLDTKHNIDILQKELSPGYSFITLENRFYYYFKGEKFPLREDDVQIHISDNIPFKYTNEKYGVYIDSMINLVLNGLIYPFILFVNGRAVKWSDISVIKDYNYTYLIVENMPDHKYHTECIYIPCKDIRYGEDDNRWVEPTKKEIVRLYFDENGYLTDTNNIAMRIEIFDENIYTTTVKPTVNKKYIHIDLPTGYESTLQNILCFKEGKNYHEGWENLEKIGHNIYKINEPNEILPRLRYKCIYAMDNKSHALMIKPLNYELFKSTMKEYANGEIEALPPWITDLIGADFDFSYDMKDTYAKNVTRALRGILRYDSSLLNPAYEAKSKIFSERYKGAFLLEHTGEDGYYKISRKRSPRVDDYVMVFVDGKLYEFYNDIRYVYNTIYVPTLGIKEKSQVEFLFFTDVNNRVSRIVTEREGEEIIISNEYDDLDECELFSQDPIEMAYDFEIDKVEHRTQYLVDFNYEKIDVAKYKLQYIAKKYYTSPEPVIIASKRQFRHIRYTNRPDEFKFLLPWRFNFCHDINKYMVFINGKMISRKYFTVTITNELRPFDKLYLYIATWLLEGDVMDVFYIPDELKDVTHDVDIDMDQDGDIQVPDEILDYNISKDLHFIFINGLKINPDNIIDVCQNRLRIARGPVDGVYNVDILQHIDQIDLFTKVFSEDAMGAFLGDPDTQFYDMLEHAVQTVVSKLGLVKDQYTEYIERMTTNVYYNSPIKAVDIDDTLEAWDPCTIIDGELLMMIAKIAMKADASISDLYANWVYYPAGKDYTVDYYKLKTIIYEIVQEYYTSRHPIRTNDQFVFDFETEWLEQVEEKRVSLVDMFSVQNDKLFLYDPMMDTVWPMYDMWGIDTTKHQYPSAIPIEGAKGIQVAKTITDVSTGETIPVSTKKVGYGNTRATVNGKSVRIST